MNLLPSEDPLSIPQLFGEAAMAVMVAANMFKNDRRLNQTFILSNSLWVVHYTLMLGWPGALACFMHIVRGLGALYGPQGHRMKTFWIMAVLYTAAVMPFVHRPADMFPLLGSYLMCVAFYLAKGVRTRYFVFASLALWLAYAAAMGSIGGMIGMVLSLSILLRTIGKMRREELVKIEPDIQNRRAVGDRAD
jgi:hypothetical protein